MFEDELYKVKVMIEDELKRLTNIINNTISGMSQRITHAKRAKDIPDLKSAVEEYGVSLASIWPQIIHLSKICHDISFFLDAKKENDHFMESMEP